MNNDRELLELAAKAAGYEVTPHENAKYSRDLHFIYKSRNWNPLSSDGDALRLAVKLGLMVDVQNEYVQVFWNGSQRLGLIIKVQLDNEPYAATRRAIVKAAAEIGRTM